MLEVVELLKEQGKTISTMESCTGGSLVNSITNISGASDVIKFSAVTYSNEFKIKMGVDECVIDKYSVYSIETAMEMSKVICKFTNSNYGVGITGKLCKLDKNNLYGEDNKVYISIYDKDLDKFYNYDITVTKDSRIDNKEDIVKFIKDKLLEILN